MNIKRLLFGFVLGLLALLGFRGLALAEAPQPDRNAPVVVRLPEPEKLKALQEDSDFQYGQDVRPALTWWDRLMRRFRDFIADIVGSQSYEGFWKYVILAFAFGVTIFVVLKLLQVDFTGLFSRQPARVAMTYETLEENIHEMDFPALIEEAVQQQDFRKAVRLSYLHVLKTLTDRELINWSPGKTNRSYVRELSVPALRSAFEKITETFEFVWYGGSKLSEPDFVRTRQAFADFNHQVKVRI